MLLFCESWWESTLIALLLMLYWSEQMIRNYTSLLPNISEFFPWAFSCNHLELINFRQKKNVSLREEMRKWKTDHSTHLILSDYFRVEPLKYVTSLEKKNILLREIRSAQSDKTNKTFLFRSQIAEACLPFIARVNSQLAASIYIKSPFPNVYF